MLTATILNVFNCILYIKSMIMMIMIIFNQTKEPWRTTKKNIFYDIETSCLLNRLILGFRKKNICTKFKMTCKIEKSLIWNIFYIFRPYVLYMLYKAGERIWLVWDNLSDIFCLTGLDNLCLKMTILYFNNIHCHAQGQTKTHKYCIPIVKCW